MIYQETLELFGPIHDDDEFAKSIERGASEVNQNYIRGLMEDPNTNQGLLSFVFDRELIQNLETSEVFRNYWHVINDDTSEDPIKDSLGYIDAVFEDIKPFEATDEGVVVRGLWKWIHSTAGKTRIEYLKSYAKKRKNSLEHELFQPPVPGRGTIKIKPLTLEFHGKRTIPEPLSAVKILNFLYPDNNVILDTRNILNKHTEMHKRPLNAKEEKQLPLVDQLRDTFWNGLLYGHIKPNQIFDIPLKLLNNTETNNHEDSYMGFATAFLQGRIKYLDGVQPTIISREEFLRLSNQPQFQDNWGRAVDRYGNILPPGQSQPFDPWGIQENNPYNQPQGPWNGGYHPR